MSDAPTIERRNAGPRRLAAQEASRRRVTIGLLGLLVAALAGVWMTLGHGDGEGHSGDAGDARGVAAAVATDPLTAGRLPIDGLQRRLADQPADWGAWAALGFAYVDEGRVSADPAFYPKAQGAFERALELRPRDNVVALAGRGALANARHDFSDGLSWAERALAVDPRHPQAQAVAGDALVELGRYEEGFAAWQRMLDAASGVGSLARASYAADLRGDVAGARRALDQALAAARTPADAAFVLYSLGELVWHSTGDVAAARGFYERAAQRDARFVPAQAGLARTTGASGDLAGAAEQWRRVVERAPLPDYVAEWAATLVRAGRGGEAEEAFALSEAQSRLARANGVNGDLEVALFSADHRRGLDEGLRAARAEWDRRRSIHVADALAWQLHVHGRHAEALGYADQALRLGTRNALFHFHRGMIHRALGNAAAARSDLEEALAINPNFSVLHAPAAAEALESLGGR